MSWSFSFAEVISITTVRCVCVWEEFIVIPLFLHRSSRKKQRLQPEAAWVDVFRRVCVFTQS